MKGQKAFCHKNNLAKVHFFIKEQQILPGFVKGLAIFLQKIGQIDKSWHIPHNNIILNT